MIGRRLQLSRHCQAAGCGSLWHPTWLGQEPPTWPCGVNSDSWPGPARRRQPEAAEAVPRWGPARASWFNLASWPDLSSHCDPLWQYPGLATSPLAAHGQAVAVTLVTSHSHCHSSYSDSDYDSACDSDRGLSLTVLVGSEPSLTRSSLGSADSDHDELGAPPAARAPPVGPRPECRHSHSATSDWVGQVAS